MREEDFLFSLYPNDLVYIASKRGIKGKLPDKLAKKSSLPQKKTQTEGLFYYRGTDIFTASVKIIAFDGTYEFRGLGVRALQRLEKWTVDVLGGELHPVKRETRQGFAAMKRDPHAPRR